jgi:hypothetical protein
MLEHVELPAGLDGPVVRHIAGEVRPRPHRHAELVGRAELSPLLNALLAAGRPSADR